MASRVSVYTMDYCAYCERAKRLLASRGVAFQEIHVASDDDRHWDELYRRSGMRTMPQIFVSEADGTGERLIGGYAELAALDARDGLASLKAPAD